MRVRKKRRTFRAKVRASRNEARTQKYIALIESANPMIAHLTAEMLPPGQAWQAITPDGEIYYAYRTDQYREPLEYTSPDGSLLISLRCVPEDGPEWQRLQNMAAS